MKVHADLLALATPPGLGGGDAATALLRTLRMAAPRGGEAEHGGEAGRGGRVTKSIVDAYNETYTTLLRYCCNVMTAESEAPVWTRLANCHKSEQHTVLTQELQKVCVARGLSSELAICPNHHYCPQANGRRFPVWGAWSRRFVLGLPAFPAGGICRKHAASLHGTSGRKASEISWHKANRPPASRTTVPYERNKKSSSRGTSWRSGSP